MYLRYFGKLQASYNMLVTFICLHVLHFVRTSPQVLIKKHNNDAMTFEGDEFAAIVSSAAANKHRIKLAVDAVAGQDDRANVAADDYKAKVTAQRPALVTVPHPHARIPCSHANVHPGFDASSRQCNAFPLLPHRQTLLMPEAWQCNSACWPITSRLAVGLACPNVSRVSHSQCLSAYDAQPPLLAEHELTQLTQLFRRHPLTETNITETRVSKHETGHQHGRLKSARRRTRTKSMGMGMMSSSVESLSFRSSEHGAPGFFVHPITRFRTAARVVMQLRSMGMLEVKHGVRCRSESTIRDAMLARPSTGHAPTGLSSWRAPQKLESGALKDKNLMDTAQMSGHKEEHPRGPTKHTMLMRSREGAEAILRILEAQCLIDEMPSDMAIDLCRCIELIECPQATTLFKEGGRAESLYIVLKGHVTLHHIDADATFQRNREVLEERAHRLAADSGSVRE